jgi:hypothetical protein
MMMNQPPRSHEIFKALSLLRPYDTKSMAKRRVGPNHDGGYVLFDDFDNISTVYSFGIGQQTEFDRAFAEMGKQLYMFDHTISDILQPHDNFHFFRQGISGRNDPEQSIFTLDHHIEQCGHKGCTDLALKMDVEGAEYEALIEASTDTLTQFRQIVIEVHWLSRLVEPTFRSEFVDCLEKINSKFTLCHVHANNCAPVIVIDGYVVADVLELTFVRSDLVESTCSQTVYPSSIDHANAWWLPDHLLWFYPFLPMNLRDEKEADKAINASLIAAEQTVLAYQANVQAETPS